MNDECSFITIHHSSLKQRLARRLLLAEIIYSFVAVIESVIGFVYRGGDFCGCGLQACGSPDCAFTSFAFASILSTCSTKARSNL